jgi:hypothetical protein
MSLEPVAGAKVCVPAGQTPSGKQLDWLASVENVPGAHAIQTRSLVGLPAVLTKVPGAQSVQGVHALALNDALAEPLAQAVQARSVVALPSVRTRWPATQSVHATHAVAAEESWSQVPAAQAVLGAEPPGQWVPGSHTAHSSRPDDGTTRAVPAVHESCGVHVSWFGAVDTVPLAHGEHCWSFVEDPLTATNVPASQTVQAVHRIAFSVVLKLPLGQPAQTRSLVAVGAADSYEPGKQLDVTGWFWGGGGGRGAGLGSAGSTVRSSIRRDGDVSSEELRHAVSAKAIEIATSAVGQTEAARCEVVAIKERSPRPRGRMSVAVVL